MQKIFLKWSRVILVRFIVRYDKNIQVFIKNEKGLYRRLRGVLFSMQNKYNSYS